MSFLITQTQVSFLFSFGTFWRFIMVCISFHYTEKRTRLLNDAHPLRKCQYADKKIHFLFPSMKSIGANKTQNHIASIYIHTTIYIYGRIHSTEHNSRIVKTATIIHYTNKLKIYLRSNLLYSSSLLSFIKKKIARIIIFNWCFSDYLNEKEKSCGIMYTCCCCCCLLHYAYNFSFFHSSNALTILIFDEASAVH